MTIKRKIIYLNLVLIFILILAFFADNSEKLGFCQSMKCGDILVFAIGRPLLQLFSFLLPFSIFLLFLNKQTLSYWFKAILLTLPIPLVATFLTPMNCSGFLGCIPSREQTAWLTGALYVGVFVLAIAIRAFARWKKK